MTRLYLCSFASPDLKKSVIRFKSQSDKINLYDGIKVYGWKDLSQNKKNQIKKFIKGKKKRLFGYGCWKPEIILNNLEKIPKDSILQYSDIGCHLNLNGQKKLEIYKNIASDKGVLAFQYFHPNFFLDKKLRYQIYYENEFTKKDLLEYFGVTNNLEILNSEQIWSGTMFFKNDEKTIIFLKKWLEVCNISSLIDDSPSLEKNQIEFVQHRHDQSAFSILCKKNDIFCLSASECEWALDENGRYWSHLNDFPILAKRDKKYNFLKRFIIRQKKNFNRRFGK